MSTQEKRTRAKYEAMTLLQLRNACSQSWLSTAGTKLQLIESLVDYEKPAGGWPAASASSAAVARPQEYTCVQKSLVRQGFEMTTDRVGALERGTVIVALEERVNEKGVTRVHFDRGWVSKKASDGSMILQARAPCSEVKR